MVKKIIVTDTLSQFINDLNQRTTDDSSYLVENISECFDIDEMPEGKFTITFIIID